MKCAILGHSQLRHVNINNISLRNSTDIVAKFFVPGITLDTVYETDVYRSFVEFRPDLVILFLGSNDIVESNCDLVKTVVDRVNYLVDKIYTDVNPRFDIRFLEFEQRVGNNRFVTEQTYRKVRNAISKKLKKISNIKFVTLTPWDFNASCIGVDGVHLNTKGIEIIETVIEHLICEL